jgi:hypothetical protein
MPKKTSNPSLAQQPAPRATKPRLSGGYLKAARVDGRLVVVRTPEKKERT